MIKSFLVVLFVFGLAQCKPTNTNSTSYCQSCSRLASFSTKLFKAMEDRETRDNLIKWCIKSGLGSDDEVCHYLINSVKSRLGKIDTSQFCMRIDACPTPRSSRLGEDAASRPPPPSPRPGDVECDFCMNTLSHVKEIVSSPQTITEVKMVLESGCKAVKELRHECTELLDENLDNIFKFIREKFDPRKFCEQVGACQTPGTVGDIKVTELALAEVINIYPAPFGELLDREGQEEKTKAGPECLLCHLFMHIIARELEKNATVNDIEAVLEETCSKLFKDQKMIECQQKVEKYTKEMVDIFTRGMGPEVICLMFGCKAADDITFFDNLRQRSVACNFCQQVMSKIYNVLSANSTEEEINRAIDSACSALPENQQNSCKILLKAYEDELVKVIAEAKDPKEACEKLGLCNSANSLKPKTVDPECILCRKIFKFLYEYIQSERTEKKIEEALDKVCDQVFPSTRKLQCEKFVAQYTAQIIEVLLQTTDPREACYLMSFCPQKRTENNAEVIVDIVPMVLLQRKTIVRTKPQESGNILPMILLQGKAVARIRPQETVDVVPMMNLNRKAVVKTEQDSPLCDVCKSIFTTVNDIIKQNGTSIAEALEKVCNTCPAKEKCQQVLDKYFERILDMLEERTEPDVACAALKLCDGQKSFVGEREENPVETSESGEHEERNNEVESEGDKKFHICFECQAVTRIIQQELYNYKTEEEITNFIRKDICPRLVNSQMKEACQSFITQYGDSIIQMIALKIFDPDVICERELKLCPQIALPVSAPSTPQVDFVFQHADQEKTCNLCVDLVTKLSSMDITPSTPSQEIGTRACAHHTENKLEQCKDLYNAFGKHFLTLKAFEKPAKICSVVDLCYHTNPHPHLLGGEKCTFGPTYWCHTQAHAEACKATKFCESKVWKPIE